ncbi:T9SS type A sorting domain-containing protein [Winogradskyella litoriviva]|uniref:T9SS type A sorting domain-containing protein n=1 Tax=Winogradskyella litoriviva TaxID=1220182 RepID=A0ABX2E2Y2_9FLAO|nr:T9SS type A sorting domain-containing protein [Winogradskyella litoriviva]NRD22858.1 T9SS type A sorting domain-containing protein [Winogradskyella litoriviva]
MKKIVFPLILFLVSLPSFAIEIASTSATQITGGLNVNVETFWHQGFSLLSSEFSIENNVIHLSICLRDEGTLAFHQEDNDFFIPLTNSGNYTINIGIIVSSLGSTTCDSTVVSDTDSISAEYNSLSTNDFEDLEKEKFIIYPNPASTKVNLKFEKVFFEQICLLDSFGREIIKLDNSNNENIQFDISYLNNGIYFIAVETDNKVFYRKLIKN